MGLTFATQLFQAMAATHLEIQELQGTTMTTRIEDKAKPHELTDESPHGWSIFTPDQLKDPLGYQKSWLMYHGEAVLMLQEDGHVTLRTRDLYAAKAAYGREMFAKDQE